MDDLNAVALEQLRTFTTDCLREHLKPGTSVALLDFPRHDNAGDSLIWLGTLEYLAALGVSVRYVSSLHHLDEKLLRRRLPYGKILIHGGGNLGDRWTDHQAFKEAVLSAFPDREIIQLPQSLEFSSEEAFERVREKFDDHASFTVLIRERGLFEKYSRLFKRTKIAYCPDLALGYRPVFDASDPTVDVVALHRTDNEVVAENLGVKHRMSADSNVLLTDWKLAGMFPRVAWWLLRLPENIVRVMPAAGGLLYPLVALSFDRMARFNVKSAIALLSRGRAVSTDRLHAMVLARLIGIPVVASDNINRKVSRIYSDYVRSLGGVLLADSRDAAVEQAKKIASGREARDGK